MLSTGGKSTKRAKAQSTVIRTSAMSRLLSTVLPQTNHSSQG